MNINPEVMKALAGHPLYECVNRATGRSTALVLRGLVAALSHPGTPVYVQDHHGGHKPSRMVADNLLHLARGITAVWVAQWFRLDVVCNDGAHFLCITNTHIQPLTKPTSEIYVS